MPIVTGEIAEDITSYYASSEQLPTVCALGVLVNPDLSIKAAGGFVIQLLPTADDDAIDAVERCIKGIEPVTKMLENGMTPEEICRHVLPEFNIEVLDESDPVYECKCTRDRVERALLSTGKESLEEISQDKITKVTCQFCDKVYTFTSEDIKGLIKTIEE